MSNIFFDARCLQDPQFQYRGIGQHSSSIVRGYSELGDRKLVGLVDKALPELPQNYRDLFHEIRSVAYNEPVGDDWFVQLSPMTHSPLNSARFLSRQARLAAVIVYDFIPHDMPERYLAGVAEKLAYQVQLAWLREYDFYLPISRYSAERLKTICQADEGQLAVTGVAVRDSVVCKAEAVFAEGARKSILVAAGGDSRKNYDAPIVSHARSKKLRSIRARLVIAGISHQPTIERCRQRHYEEGGDPQLLAFLSAPTDAQLGRAYAEAVVTVCPSRIEGFSIPVIEATANGSPVIVSNCAAQKELVPDGEYQFDPDDTARLGAMLERFCFEPARRREAMESQKDIALPFTEAKVAARFWNAIETFARARPPSPPVQRNAKPRILIDTPLPPDQSGIADWAKALLAELALHADCFVASDTPEPNLPPNCTLVGRSTPLSYVSAAYDRVISVVGNSHFHVSAVRNLLRFGAAGILHDARMIDFYYHLFGEARAVAVASEELGSPISRIEVYRWLTDQTRLPTLFLRELVQASRPAIVHSRLTQTLVQELYGLATHYLPFPIYRMLGDADRSPERRARARQPLGLPKARFLISSFGAVIQDKGLAEIVEGLAHLRKLGVDAHLHFVGTGPQPMLDQIDRDRRDLGVVDHVSYEESFVSEDRYREFLSATDAAVQLRKYAFGGLSGGLLDCIAAGIPSVSNAHLAGAMEAPDYVAVVPDNFTGRDIGDALSRVVSGSRPNLEEPRRAFVKDHELGRYSRLLFESLEL
ncbi:hypothetical protein BH10PSE9_BH10PSE9_03810 [soil metagenome]